MINGALVLRSAVFQEQKLLNEIFISFNHLSNKDECVLCMCCWLWTKYRTTTTAFRCLAIIRTFCILPTSMYLSAVETDTDIVCVFGLSHRQQTLVRCHSIFSMPTQSNNSSSLKFHQDIYLNFHRHNGVFVSCLLC